MTTGELSLPRFHRLLPLPQFPTPYTLHPLSSDRSALGVRALDHVRRLLGVLHVVRLGNAPGRDRRAVGATGRKIGLPATLGESLDGVGGLPICLFFIHPAIL